MELLPSRYSTRSLTLGLSIRLDILSGGLFHICEELALRDGSASCERETCSMVTCSPERSMSITVYFTSNSGGVAPIAVATAS